MVFVVDVKRERGSVLRIALLVHTFFPLSAYCGDPSDDTTTGMHAADGGGLKTYVRSSASPYATNNNKITKKTVNILNLLILTIASRLSCRSVPS